MAWPGDEIAAAEGRGRGELRASHADREQVVSTLKAAFVQGMLAKDELDQRVGHAFASRTYAELAALTADIPADVADTSPAPAGSPSTPARTMAKAAGRSGICLLVAVALAEGAFLADNLLLLVAASFALIAASGFFGYGILDAWQERRSRGRGRIAGGCDQPVRGKQHETGQRAVEQQGQQIESHERSGSE